MVKPENEACVRSTYNCCTYTVITHGCLVRTWCAHLLLMQVLYSTEDLLHEVADLWLREGLPPFVQLHHGATSTQLKKDVHMVLVLKGREGIL